MTPEQATEKLNKELDALHECVMNQCLQRIKEKTPVNTGRLQQSWKQTDKNTISSDVEYAIYVELGTRYMAPVGMLRTTALEAQSIADGCAKKVFK